MFSHVLIMYPLRIIFQTTLNKCIKLCVWQFVWFIPLCMKFKSLKTVPYLPLYHKCLKKHMEIIVINLITFGTKIYWCINPCFNNNQRIYNKILLSSNSATKVFFMDQRNRSTEHSGTEIHCSLLFTENSVLSLLKKANLYHLLKMLYPQGFCVKKKLFSFNRKLWNPQML